MRGPGGAAYRSDWDVQEPEKKPDYEQQVSKELDRIQQRTLLLNEMLNNTKPKERFADGDSYHVRPVRCISVADTDPLTNAQQIANKCRQVQPKIQKWIEESAENDPGSMGASIVHGYVWLTGADALRAIDRLLLMNDLINNVVRRYEAFKAGDRNATADIDATCVSPCWQITCTRTLTRFPMQVHDQGLDCEGQDGGAASQPNRL